MKQTQDPIEKAVAELSDEQYNLIRFRNDIQDHEVDIISAYKQQEAHSEQEIQEMRERFDKAEKALAEHGIEFRITNFQEYELATWQLMKIESDEQ